MRWDAGQKKQVKRIAGWSGDKGRAGEIVVAPGLTRGQPPRARDCHKARGARRDGRRNGRASLSLTVWVVAESCSRLE